MCVQCAFNASEAAASAGGPTGVVALLAAAAARAGAGSLAGWLAAREVGWVTQRRAKAFVVASAMLGLIVATQLL
jgi:hypothetical protein